MFALLDKLCLKFSRCTLESSVSRSQTTFKRRVAPDLLIQGGAKQSRATDRTFQRTPLFNLAVDWI